MTTIPLIEFDVEARFWMLASQGSVTGGLGLLNTLWERHQEAGIVPNDDN